MSANASSDRGLLREAVRNRRLLGVAIIAAIGGFLFGYDTGVIGGALLFMQKDLNLTSHGQQQLTVAILLLGAIVGALISGWAADRFSRRRTKIVSGTVYVTGAVGCALAQSYWQILAGRFWLGLAVGTASFVSPMYIAELVPPRIRGGVVSFNQLMVTLGILVAYVVDCGLRRAAQQLALDVRTGSSTGRCACDRDVLHAVLAALADPARAGRRGTRGSRHLPHSKRTTSMRRSRRSRTSPRRSPA